MISNSTEPVVPKYLIRCNNSSVKMSGFRHFSKTSNIFIFFVTNGLDMALFDNDTHFYYVSRNFDQKLVFLKTTCSPTDPSSDLQNVKNPGPTPKCHQNGL